MWNVVRFIGYTMGGYALRASYNWLTQDVDPVPGTKEFAVEYRKVYTKYKRMKGAYETYRKNNR